MADRRAALNHAAGIARTRTTRALVACIGLLVGLLVYGTVPISEGAECSPAAAHPRTGAGKPAPKSTGTKKAAPLPGTGTAICSDREAYPSRACLTQRSKLCARDMEVARIAWKYFERNYQESTGMVNSVDGYPSSTMWDIGSSLAGTLAARDLGLITQKAFDDRIMALLRTLNTQKLFRDEAPNKAYNTKTGEMSDYVNKPTDGIGFSALDLGRIVSWLNILSCLHPKYAVASRNVLLRWKYCELIKDGQMYGAIVDPTNKKVRYLQEGRLGYEQYSGKLFAQLGFDLPISAHYKNPNATAVQIYDVTIPVDSRDPRKLGAYNYVVTESYALDAMELGLDNENAQLVRNIYEVQKRRWRRTGIVTAVSEDNIDQSPYFIYNTIFAAGSAWNTITDQGVAYDALKNVSIKAAFSLVTLFPNDPYSDVLWDRIESAYDAEKGWYSGIYENGIGYNKSITANTNGIILEALLYKKYGPLNRLCLQCGSALRFTEQDLGADKNKDRCLPGQPRCNSCL